MRAKLLDFKSTVCIDRARIITKVYKEHPEQPIVLKRALAMQAILEEMPIFIDDGELIAVIAAAIAASENTSTDSFVVRSIRKSKKGNWHRA